MQIQNADATEVIRKQAGLTLAEGFPQNLLPNIQPVMDMTPRFHRNTTIVRTFNKTTSGNSTIYTTPTDKDFYLVGIQMNLSKDATSDSVTIAITATIDGVSRDIARMPMQTLIAITSLAFSRDFYRPIKIDRGTVISVSASFTVGTQTCNAQILGYES